MRRRKEKRKKRKSTDCNADVHANNLWIKFIYSTRIEILLMSHSFTWNNLWNVPHYPCDVLRFFHVGSEISQNIVQKSLYTDMQFCCSCPWERPFVMGYHTQQALGLSWNFLIKITSVQNFTRHTYPPNMHLWLLPSSASTWTSTWLKDEIALLSLVTVQPSEKVY